VHGAGRMTGLSGGAVAWAPAGGNKDIKISLCPMSEVTGVGLGPKHSLSVMAGLVPAIHDLTTTMGREVVDALHRAGHDGWWFRRAFREGSLPEPLLTEIGFDTIIAFMLDYLPR